MILIVIGQHGGRDREEPCILVPLQDCLLSREAGVQDYTRLTNPAYTLNCVISNQRLIT